MRLPRAGVDKEVNRLIIDRAICLILFFFVHLFAREYIMLWECLNIFLDCREIWWSGLLGYYCCYNLLAKIMCEEMLRLYCG